LRLFVSRLLLLLSIFAMAATTSCSICDCDRGEIEWAAPANDNHLLLAGLSSKDLAPGGDSCDRLIWKRRNGTFRMALLKNADKTQPVLNRSRRKLHLSPDHKTGYYLYGNSTTEILDSFCDGLRWSQLQKMRWDDYAKDVTVTDPPVYRYISIIQNGVYDQGPLAGCVFVHVRYSHSDGYMAPAIEGIVLDPRLALKDFSKIDPVRTRYSIKAPELDLRSVLDTEFEMLEAYKLHALPGSCYLVDRHSFEFYFAPSLKFDKIGDVQTEENGQRVDFESRSLSTVAGLVGFVAAPYCVVQASLRSPPLGCFSLDKSFALVTFVAACVMCSQTVYEPKELVAHLGACVDAGFEAQLHFKNVKEK